MNIYNIIQNFWEKNEHNQCSLSEISLYFYLIHEANRQHWTSPFCVNTQILAAKLGTSKQNVLKAREGLAERDIISYEKGDGKGKPALYQLNLGLSERLEHPQQLTHPLTRQLSHPLPHPLSQKTTQPLSQPLSPPNIKEEDKICNVKEGKISLDDLKVKLIADTEWLQALSKQLSEIGISLSEKNLISKLNDFFSDLKVRNVNHKEEGDCRNHVFNWIKYHYKNYTYGQKTIINSQVGRAQISDNLPHDYRGSC